MSNKRNRHYEDVLEQGRALIEFYLNNPCIAAYDLLGVDFAPIQRLVFNDMWFKNYNIVVAGRGFGKCTHVNSMVNYKDKGLVYLNEVLPPIPSYLRSGQDEIINWEDELYTSDGFKKTKKLCFEKGVKGRYLITQNGFEQKGSSHHPILTIDINGNFEYKKLIDFKTGDRICIQRGQRSFGTNTIPEDDAYLIGLFLGGGGTIGGEYPCSITTSDQEIKLFCINYCLKHNINFRRAPDKRTKDTESIVFKKFDWFFEKYGINRVLSYDKSVPYSIRTAEKNVQKSFLRGYFDADGTTNRFNGGTSCCSVSKKLIAEIQMMLLNFGIISRLRKKPTKSNFGKAFILDMFSDESFKFLSSVGFGLKRKRRLLEKYFEKHNKSNPNKDTIPNVKELCQFIKDDYRNSNGKHRFDSTIPALPFNGSNKKELTYYYLLDFIHNVERLLCAGYKFSTVSLNLVDRLKNIFKEHYYFDTVVEVGYWEGDCYDFEMDMEGEPNYFANGFINHNTFLLGVLSALSCMLRPGYRVGLIAPVFRQSKMVFSEVEKLYAQSSILREATEKRPTRGSDTCYLKFKSVSGMTPSFIEALPLGDGNKIRGSRFYLIVVDELAQVPDQTLDMVVRPMAATSLAPMERVRRLEQKKRLIDLGLATEEDFEEETVNKMVMTSSGYYKFNHMWRRMKDHWRQMEEADRRGEVSPYSVWQIPHWDLPEGFLDKNNIEEARRIMSNSEFRMEYEAAMISDSEGFFKASSLESCTLGSGHTIELNGSKEAQYILGIDPNQGGRASAGIVVIRAGSVNRIVNVIELKKMTTPQLTTAIQDLCDQYNIIRIFMDQGGGGKAICDLLEEGYNGYVPIINRTDDEHKHLDGRHILDMVNFNPAWISDANFTTKAMIEDKKLLFPEAPILTTLDLPGIQYDNVTTLKSQMLNIVVTQTATGVLHFDTPTKGQNKDLYSALILAAHGARIIEKELEGDAAPILHNNGGFIRPRSTGRGDFRPIANGGPSIAAKPIHAAILKKKIK